MPLIPVDTKGKQLAKKLAKLQNLINYEIEYPFAGLDNKVLDFILSLSFSNKREAEISLEKIKKYIAENNKPKLSIAVYEEHKKDILVSRQLLDVRSGLRWPIPKPTIADDKKQAELNESIKNVNYQFLFKTYINVSPATALNYIMEKSKANNIVHHGVLTDRITNNICEYATAMATYYESIEKKLWYDITYCRAVLSQFETWERWCNEASYFLEVKKDIKRAYIAAKEGYKNNKTNEEVQLQFGWCAFLNNQILQAVKLTKGVLTSSDDEIRFFAFANLGLYNLALSKKDNQFLEQAKYYYDEVKGLYENNNKLPLHIILSDIKTFVNSLHKDYAIYIKQLEQVI